MKQVFFTADFHLGDHDVFTKDENGKRMLINRHATRFRLITATLGNRMNELITLLGEGHEKEV